MGYLCLTWSRSRSQEPETKTELKLYHGYGSGCNQKFRLLAAPAQNSVLQKSWSYWFPTDYQHSTVCVIVVRLCGFSSSRAARHAKNVCEEQLSPYIYPAI
jgi:hypothetical protein